MNSPLGHSTIVRLEKAAEDNGFDLRADAEAPWISYTSSRSPLRIWLTALGEGLFLVAVSQRNVAETLAGYGYAFSNPLPAGAVGARAAPDIPQLHLLVQRAFQLSRNLPDELLHTFQTNIADLPSTTEAERQVIQRVGQDLFRESLLEFWEGRCAITGLAVPALLRSSHIKPWADCETDAERLDVFNGLLLAPHLDAAFDRGFITVEDSGAVVVSERLDDAARAVLGLDRPLVVGRLAEGHRRYLGWHRERVYQATCEPSSPSS